MSHCDATLKSVRWIRTYSQQLSFKFESWVNIRAVEVWIKPNMLFLHFGFGTDETNKI